MKKEYFEDDKEKIYPYLSFNFTEQEKIYAIRTALLKSQHTVNYPHLKERACKSQQI